MEITAIIPARYGSSRFPGKPLADIGGKPMIQRVYEQTGKAFANVFVATDDERIASTVRNFGGHAVMTSALHQSGTDRCNEAADIIQRDFGLKPDVIVNVQGDEPFIDPEQLTALASCFSDENVQIATLVKKFGPGEDIFNENSPKVVVSLKGFALYFSRTPVPFMRDFTREKWQESHTYFKHIGLYAYRREVLRSIAGLPQSSLEKCEKLEQLRWLENGFGIKVAETDKQSWAIDTPEDLENLKQQGLF
jgi:3-deoxy-manno-octulosonate cytidylyltransferase (CMP-KDO synthetase)